MASMAAAGFGEPQTQAIVGLIAGALDRAGSDAARNLNEAYAKKAQIASDTTAQQSEMAQFFQEINEEKEIMKDHMERINREAETTKLTVAEVV